MHSTEAVGPDPLLQKLRSICLALPETVETVTWGHPNFRVGKKIFASYSRHEGQSTTSFKTDLLIQEQLVKTDPRFTPAHYVGHHGWVTMELSGKLDWKKLEGFIRDSYRTIAPKKLGRLLDETTPAAGQASTKRTRKKG